MTAPKAWEMAAAGGEEPPECGRVAPWGPVCKLPAGHHQAHAWSFLPPKKPASPPKPKRLR